MARPREHYSRFIDLDEKDKNRKPCVTIADQSPCDEGDDFQNKCHKRVTSDVVKTVESLDYAIITRAGAKNQVSQEQLS